MQIELRPVQPTDLDLLVYWSGKPHVASALGSDTGWDWREELAMDPDWRELLIAHIGGRPVGILQIIDPAREEAHYWGDIEPNLRAIDIWIGEPEDLGRGYGTQMMQLALARCFADPAVEAVLVDPLASNAEAVRFYERCGFRAAGRRVFEKEVCLVMRVDRPAG